MASSKLNILQKWFEENKIQWDKTSFEITEISSGNFGVRALKDMTKDTPGKEAEPYLCCFFLIFFFSFSCQNTQRMHPFDKDMWCFQYYR